MRWEASGRTAVVLWRAASRICSKQHVAFYCCYHLAFSPIVSLESSRSIYTVVRTRSQLGINPILFYQRSDCYMINKLSIAVHLFAMHVLTSLSVDEILLPKYVNWFTNFRDLPFGDWVDSLREGADSAFRPFLCCVLFIHSVAWSKQYLVKFPCLSYFRSYFVEACSFYPLKFFSTTSCSSSLNC